MADEAVAAAEGKEAKEPVKAEKAGPSMVSLILVVLVAVVVSVGGLGGAAYWLVKSGRLPIGGAPAKVEAATKVVVEEPKSRMVALDPLLVNLADEGGKSYVRVAIALRVVDPPPVKGAKEKPEEKPEKGKVVINEDDVLMRDAALEVLGRQTGAVLLAPDGKERVKAQLRAALQASVPKLKVVDVLFTDFLVQR